MANQILIFKAYILSRNLIQVKVQNNVENLHYLHCHITSTFYYINSNFKSNCKRENLIRLKPTDNKLRGRS